MDPKYLIERINRIFSSLFNYKEYSRGTGNRDILRKHLLRPDNARPT